MCPASGFSLPEAEPNIFSFNSPHGACPKCNGIGEVTEIAIDKIIPDDKLSIKKGGIAPLGKYKANHLFKQVELILKNDGITLDTPIHKIPEDVVNVLLYGSDELIKVLGENGVNEIVANFEGIINFVSRHKDETSSKQILRWAESFTNKTVCSLCNGGRLKESALLYRVDGRSIHLITFFDNRGIFHF